MAEARVTIHHQSGLHARPAALFVRTAAGFAASIRITNLSRDLARSVDAKSIISVMALGVEQGHELLIHSDGDDEDAALAALTELIASDFANLATPAPTPSDAVPSPSQLES